MSHLLLQDPKFFRRWLRIYQVLARQTRAAGCVRSGVLHSGDYPRKPRVCLIEVRSDFETRFSFCCNRCRKRTTSVCVRFLGRRVYLAMAVVLVSARHAGQTPAARRAATLLDVPVRTLERWRLWWQEQFPLTPLGQGACARFMPPVVSLEVPASLLVRFAGTAAVVAHANAGLRLPLTGTSIMLGKARRSPAEDMHSQTPWGFVSLHSKPRCHRCRLFWETFSTVINDPSQRDRWARLRESLWPRLRTYP